MKTTKEQRRELRAILGEHREIGVAWVPTDGGLLRELLDDVDETEAEIERLEAGWMEFESIEPGTGNLRPSHAALLRALEDARAEARRARAVEAEWLDLARRIMAAAAGHGVKGENDA